MADDEQGLGAPTGLTAGMVEWKVQDFLGMDASQAEHSLDSNHAMIAQNCRFGTIGEIIKRDPESYYNTTTLGAYPIMSAFRFYHTVNGSAKLIVVHNTKAYVGNDAAGTFTEIRSGLTDGKRCSFQVYQNLLMVANGTDDIWVYDNSADNVTWELGSCKAVAGAGTGITRTAISYRVTIDADAYVCGATSNVIATVTNKSIELTNIPLGPLGTVNRKIYRQSSETTGYRLVTTLSNNTATTYTDTTADASGGDAYPAVTDDMPKAAKMRIYRDRLFLTKVANHPQWIPYSNPYLPHFIQITTNLDYMELEDDKDPIQDIPIQLGVMCVFKNNSIRKLNIRATDPANWSAEDPISFIGSPAPWSIVQSPYGILYLSADAWYLFDGVASKEVVIEFDAESIMASRYADTVAIWNDGILKFLCTDAETGTTYHNRVYRYDFLRKSLCYDKLDVNCFCEFNSDDDTGDMYYGDSQNGFVYNAERTPMWIKYRTEDDLRDSTCADIVVGVDDSDDVIIPFFEIGRDDTIDSLTGAIDDLAGTINMNDTTGTITFKSVEINAESLGKIFWNVRKYAEGDTCLVHTRTGATQSACEAAAWSTGLSNQNGSDIASTADVWIQIKVELTAASTAGSPRVYFNNGFVIKFTYSKGGNIAESAVEFDYDIGYRNFDMPNVDKIFKKISLTYNSSELLLTGTLLIYWKTMASNGTEYAGMFTVALAGNRKTWEAFFPATAYGRSLALRFYKNDLEDIEIKEVHGLYSPLPVIV